MSAAEPLSEGPTTVGAYEAKTHLPRLLEQVQAGQIITITKHGHPVARLMPVDDARLDLPAAIARLKELRKGLSLGGLSIREAIEEGHRYR